MSLLIEAGLKYGNYNGFDYVYGIPIYRTFEEVVATFPPQFQSGSRVSILQDRNIGNVYVIQKGDGSVPNEVLNHIKEEFFDHCYEWFEFERVGDLAAYLISRGKDNTKIYHDNKRGKYYARRNRPNTSIVSDFAVCMDVEETLKIEKDLTLEEVQFKEDIKSEKKDN